MSIRSALIERCNLPKGLKTGQVNGCQIGAVAFIYRFGSTLTEHAHLHLCVVDAVFKPADQSMQSYAYGVGLCVDASVRIGQHDRAGLERLLRYCARPPFADQRIRIEGELIICRLNCSVGTSPTVASTSTKACTSEVLLGRAYEADRASFAVALLE